MRRPCSVLLLCCFIPLFSFAQGSALRWSMFDMGFALSTSGATAATSAAGQLFVGTMQAGPTRLEGGFLADSLLRRTVLSVGENEELPTTYALSQNYPNPFNPSTTIRYELPRKSNVEIDLYNIIGQHVATLAKEQQDAGRYSVVWDGRNDFGQPVATGVYVYRFVAHDVSSGENRPFVETRKLVLLH